MESVVACGKQLTPHKLKVFLHSINIETNRKMKQSTTYIRSRKDRRKEERQSRKKRQRSDSISDGDDKPNLKKPFVAPERKDPVQGREKVQKKKVGNKNSTISKSNRDDKYSNLSADVAAMMRKDDEEIAFLEEMLGTKKEKKRLHKEYAKMECYGEDFGDFLDDIDEVVKRVVTGTNDNIDDKGRYQAILSKDNKSAKYDEFIFSEGSESEDDEPEEELIPMKEPKYEEGDDEISYSDEVESSANKQSRAFSKQSIDSNESDSSNDDSDADHDLYDDKEGSEYTNDETYQPTKGEDIYGNTIEKGVDASQPKNYTPPHLRHKNSPTSTEDETAKRETLLSIQRSLNSALNRLSEDSLVPVSQSLAQLYSNFPKSDVNECLWKNAKSVCVTNTYLMTSMVPVYICTVAGVHIQKGDSAQLGEYFMEKAVLDLMSELDKLRNISQSENDVESDGFSSNKEAANLLLIICYLYNFGVAHCTLLYDIVRDLIGNFREVDVEMLLLILSHSGRALRSDDPSALKEIVLLVQKAAADRIEKSSSRTEYMVAAMLDLRNNKRRKSDESFVERTAKLRKALGQIKSSTVANGGSRTSEPAKLSLDDIINAESRGRWWKVGASWMGNQSQQRAGPGNKEQSGNNQKVGVSKKPNSDEDEALLELATKMRMNTDQRRGAFCIIMGSTDCEDCFEKLVRAGMLNPRKERDTVRVLMECCGYEKSYNKFYGHLASRLCSFQPQCKFTFQLAYWDAYKQFEDMSARKAANLSKLLYNLVAVHHCLKIQVLKAIDMASPEDLHENAMIFLTIFFTNMLEHCDDVTALQTLLDTGSNSDSSNDESMQRDGDMDHMDDRHALSASITVFLMQVMKSSPNYVRGSKFRSNLKAAIKFCDPDGFF
jgi:nucleolar MIF4G domain-containing protein 1